MRGGIALCMSVPGSTALGPWPTWLTLPPCAVTCCASVYCAMTYLGFHGTLIIANCVPNCGGPAPGEVPKITSRCAFSGRAYVLAARAAGQIRAVRPRRELSFRHYSEPDD